MLTPAAHGTLFTPLYPTPMIRALPYGFNYPIPRSWPSSDEYHNANSFLWDVISNQDDRRNDRWRGFRVITRTLAGIDHCVSDFVVDVSLLEVGLDIHMFNQPCDEYTNLASIPKPCLRRLDLPLLLHRPAWPGNVGWPAFRNGLLKKALSGATGLEHFNLRTDAYERCMAMYEDEEDDWEFDGDDCFIPRKTIFPVVEWQNLTHLRLSGFIVREDDVISLLAALPATLRSLELSFLVFQSGHGTCRTILEKNARLSLARAGCQPAAQDRHGLA
ncbi:Fc.00g031740.m01.CDS01 [Cosmosporella sp. VM-42]